MTDHLYAREYMRETVNQALSETVLGEPMSFDIAPVLVPNPQTGQMVVGYMVVVSCRSPVLSPPRIAAFAVIVDAHPNDQQLEAAVKQNTESLFEMRRQLLSTQN